MRNAADEPEIPVVPPGELELPSDDGEPMETNRHRQQMILLIQSLKRAFRGRHDFFVGGNMFVYFSEEQVKKNDFRGPDVFVVLDTTDRDRRSWVAWGENGKLPDVVIELLSERTRHIDRGEKMRIYSRIWHTSEYFLYDPWSHEFDGFRLDAKTGEFSRLEPDPQGDLRSERLGLGLSIRQGIYEGVATRWLRWIGTDGQVIETSEEGEAVARERAASSQHRADEAVRRGDEEKARADEAVRRADEAVRRADEEKARADEAERRLRELEKRIGKS